MTDSGFNHGTPPRLGILVINLGTPDAPATSAVRRYLAEFLSDRRVVEIPRFIWWFILYGIILPFRSPRSARAYRRIWTDAGSPLLVHSAVLTDALRDALGQRINGPFSVALGMRYGNPSITDALQQLRDDGAQRLLILPLYPQYAASTTATAFDAVADVLARWRRIPEVRFISGYHDRPAYIDALAASVREYRGSAGTGGKLLISFHGLPRQTLERGDPYFCHCQKTARLLAEHLGLGDDDWAISFQSRLGRAEWLKPYTSELLQDWARAGVEEVDVICPGFAADCLETLEEIAMENRDAFIAAGGRRLGYVPALNARPSHVRMLADLVMQHAAGWPETDRDWNAQRMAQDTAQTAARARQLGAGN